MRPVVAIPGILAIVAVLLVAYFSTPPAVASGTIEPTTPLGQYVASGSVAYPSSTQSLTGSIEISISYSGLRPGASILFSVCTTSRTPAECAAAGNVAIAVRHSSTLTFTLTSGHKIDMFSTAPGATYSATSPDYSSYSTILVIVAIAGLAVAIVGFILVAPEKTEKPPKPEKPRKVKPVKQPQQPQPPAQWAAQQTAPPEPGPAPPPPEGAPPPTSESEPWAEDLP